MHKDSEIRKHYYLQKTVVIAPKRAIRPTSYATKTHVVDKSTCVLCNNHERVVFSIENDDTWIIKSVKNPYGVLSLHNNAAYGVQEVIIESPDHITKFSSHSVSTIKYLLDAFAQRSDSLKMQEHIRYVSIFKNSGPHAGSTLQHAHSQVYALPFIPPSVQTEITALNDYSRRHKQCALCDIITTENDDGDRLIYIDEATVAICPFASEYPYEVWIIPLKHTVSLSKTHDEVRYSMAQIMKSITSMLEQLGLDYNFYVNDMHHAGTHSYIRITPRVAAPKIFGGLEIATDITINSVSPERAAEEYRQHVRSLLPAQRYATVK